MNDSATYAPGEKTHKDENFPVASYILRKKYRGPILAFYRFARAADDVADHPALTEQEKLLQLERFETTLLGACDDEPAALPLRSALKAHGLAPRHALDLLTAFRQDARQARYRNWEELLHYCSFSAAPVGRFVLDVHGEAPSSWAASDALCAALQIVNHLQDCKADYVKLGRVYIPQDAFLKYGVAESALREPAASPALRHIIVELAEKTQKLLKPAPLSGQIVDTRLAVEVAIIESIVHKLLRILKARDPLRDTVHLNKMQLIPLTMRAMLCILASRLTGSAKASAVSSEAA